MAWPGAAKKDGRGSVFTEGRQCLLRQGARADPHGRGCLNRAHEVTACRANEKNFAYVSRNPYF
jgi:hypothetical protein